MPIAVKCTSHVGGTGSDKPSVTFALKPRCSTWLRDKPPWSKPLIQVPQTRAASAQTVAFLSYHCCHQCVSHSTANNSSNLICTYLFIISFFYTFIILYSMLECSVTIQSEKKSVISTTMSFLHSDSVILGVLRLD